MNIIFHRIILGKHIMDVTRDRVYLIYALMWDDNYINVGVIIMSAMKKALYY